MEEKGLQLKAIHVLMKSGNLSGGGKDREETGLQQQVECLQKKEEAVTTGNYEDKLQRIQWLFTEFVKKSLEDSLPEALEQVLAANMDQYHKGLCSEIRESVVKELDYQFRMQNERDDEREKMYLERSELYYEQIDELLRRKREKKKRRFLFR